LRDVLVSSERGYALGTTCGIVIEREANPRAST
jgi:hypothetical protein